MKTTRSTSRGTQATRGSVAELPTETLEHAAECLRTLAHPHRLRMVAMLLEGEYTVGDLAGACDIPSHMASEHLRLMKDRGLLDADRRGRRTYYRTTEPALSGIINCIEGRFGSEEV